jgi:hypothetical protein
MKSFVLCSLLCSPAFAAGELVASVAPTAPIQTQLAEPAPSKLKDHFLTYGSFGFNAYTYLGATATAKETYITPASRAIIYQQAGIAYFFHKMLRMQLTLIFGETLTNLPANTNTFSTFAIVPQLVFSTHGFFTGIGPQLAAVSYGKNGNFDAGIYTGTGYAPKLGRGLTLPITVQLVVMLYQRTSVAITPSVALAYRF